MTLISIFLVVDHEAVRRGLLGYLETVPGFRVVKATCFREEAAAGAQEYAPDIALVDLSMAGRDAIDITRRIKKASPRTQVILLTSFASDDLLFLALKAGAAACFYQDPRMERLAEAIQKVHQGEITLRPRIAKKILDSLQEDSPGSEQLRGELTGREMEILRLIAGGMNPAEAAGQINASEQVIKGVFKNILSKLQLAALAGEAIASRMGRSSY